MILEHCLPSALALRFAKIPLNSKARQSMELVGDATSAGAPRRFQLKVGRPLGVRKEWSRRMRFITVSSAYVKRFLELRRRRKRRLRVPTFTLSLNAFIKICSNLA